MVNNTLNVGKIEEGFCNYQKCKEQQDGQKRHYENRMPD